MKLGDPVDCTLWFPIHVHVTVPPTAIVSTAGFVLPFRLLLKKKLPPVTAAVVGSASEVAWNVIGEPVRAPFVAVMTIAPGGASSVTVVWAMPLASLVACDGLRLAEPVVTCQSTPVPCTPVPNGSVTF